MGFLSHIIEEMFTKFGCHQLEGGVGSLFCFRSTLQRFNEFNALQVARMSSIALSIFLLVPLMPGKTTFKS